MDDEINISKVTVEQLGELRQAAHRWVDELFDVAGIGEVNMSISFNKEFKRESLPDRDVWNVIAKSLRIRVPIQ